MNLRLENHDSLDFESVNVFLIAHRQTLCVFVSLVVGCLLASMQSAPEPVAHWLIRESRYQDGQIVAARGPNLMVSGFPAVRTLDGVEGYQIKDEEECFIYPWDDRSKWAAMPKSEFTISVEFAVEDDQGTHGLAACIFQPSEGLGGWRVLIKNGKPEFTVAKPGLGSAVVAGADVLTPGKRHRLDASYDGGLIKLYVDGKMQGSAEAKFGDLIYNGRAGICFADWWEGPRSFRFKGMLFSAALFDKGITPEQVSSALQSSKVSPMPGEEGGKLGISIDPFFQYPTTSEATVVWETSRIASTVVRFGLSARSAKEMKGEDSKIHTVRMSDLKPATTYFVQVESTVEGQTVTSEWQSFRTASLPGTGVKIAIVGDTQDHPETNTIVAQRIFEERPDSLMIVGDLVGMGWKKEQWVHDFFASMRPLLSHVPLLPVIGNHDRNARIYYDLMAVPQPEYCYSYKTGDVEFFAIDTNRSVQPGSVQYKWLESALKASTAKWKIAAHHHPPYSSDTDDFGDSATGPTTDGEIGLRSLSGLYDRYQVDLCFTGHIHSYERTYPLKGGKVVGEGEGTVYVVVGGGGGGLEKAKATRSVFSRVVRSAHHFGMIWADSNRLELRAYDDRGLLFDTYEMKK